MVHFKHLTHYGFNNNESVWDIKRKIRQTYKESVSESTIRNWMKKLANGNDILTRKKGSGRPSILTPELQNLVKMQVDYAININCNHYVTC